ncbi:MAG: hypothetical protein SPK26_12945, partial [Treponema sp.]|nr:hypothetical protein [Treponema sp.]
TQAKTVQWTVFSESRRRLCLSRRSSPGSFGKLNHRVFRYPLCGAPRQDLYHRQDIPTSHVGRPATPQTDAWEELRVPQQIQVYKWQIFAYKNCFFDFFVGTLHV